MTEKPCKFYISGKKCKFGKHCRFVHSQEFQPILNSDFNQLDRNGVLNAQIESFDELNLQPISFNHQERNQNESINYSLSDSVSVGLQNTHTHKTNTPSICQFYIRNGNCGYGRNCRFYHPQPSQDQEYVNSKLNNKPVYRNDFQEVYTEKEISEGCLGQDAGDVSELPEAEQTEVNSKHDDRRQLCTFFSQYGRCKFGRTRRCKNLHFYKKKTTDLQKQNGTDTENDKVPQREEAKKNSASKPREVQNKSASKPPEEAEKKPQSKPETSKKRICSFFKSGYCRWGERCRFLHPKDIMEEDFNVDQERISTDTQDESKQLSVKANPVRKASRQPVVPVKQTPKRSTTTQDDVKKLRQTEIQQLKKRFPTEKLTIIEENDEKFVASFCFTPSDPDWPFDVKDFVLEVTIPSSYPVEVLQVRLPEDQDMPETVRRYVESSIIEWTTKKSVSLVESDNLELIFRPLLRWMEKNLEEVVTGALRQFKKELVAKAAGFEFISASELQANVKEPDTNDSQEAEDNNFEAGQDDTDNGESDESSSGSEDKEIQLASVDGEKKGTEVSFKNLQLKEQTGTLLFKKICITIQCGRCKLKTDVNTPCNRLNSVDCTKCNETQYLRFRPTIAHQYSSIIGYLDLDSCIPFDLVLPECQPVLSCMNCNKATELSGFCSGQPHDIRCRSCHEKLRVAVEAVRFLELQLKVETADIKQAFKIGVKKTRVAKNPAIQEGKPLPNNGSCKHYKKSFRWLRFPCCGKTYPCDVCHDENETDHEMKYANRMICGYCCREQIYSVEKPCKGCELLMTKSSGSHWEGGQGCRDKVKMNRGDSQKYSNMGKTISKHSQKVKDANSKKRTKLRHT